MSASMTASARRELVDALRRRYAAATRQEKTRILTEFSFVSEGCIGSQRPVF